MHVCDPVERIVILLLEKQSHWLLCHLLESRLCQSMLMLYRQILALLLSLALDSQVIAMGTMCWRGGIRADLIQKEIEFNCTSLEDHLAWIYHYGLKHPIYIIKTYLARSFRSSRPSLFLSKIFIYKSRRQR